MTELVGEWPTSGNEDQASAIEKVRDIIGQVSEVETEIARLAGERVVLAMRLKALNDEYGTPSLNLTNSLVLLRQTPLEVE